MLAIFTTGDSDIVVSECGTKVAKVIGDNPMLSKVTGTGCALGGLVSAAVGTVCLHNKAADSTKTAVDMSRDALFDAVLAVHYLYTAAGMKAKTRLTALTHTISSSPSSYGLTNGPGSQSIAFVDELYYLSNNLGLIADYASIIDLPL